MSFFAVHYTYADVDLEGLRPQHREYLRSLADQGQLRASGPYELSEGPGRALLIFTVDSEETVRELLAGDPFQQAGYVTTTEVLAWKPLIGVFKDEA